MARLFRRSDHQAEPHMAATTAHDLHVEAEAKEGSLRYVAATGDNTHLTTFQHAAGAPVETKSPLGTDVGPVTIIFVTNILASGTSTYAKIS